MCIPAKLGSPRHKDPAKEATFCFISGLLSSARRPSMADTGPIYAMNWSLLASMQVLSSSINSTRTSSAIGKYKLVKNFLEIAIYLHCSAKGDLFMRFATAGRRICASSLSPILSIALYRYSASVDYCGTYFPMISMASSRFFSI